MINMMIYYWKDARYHLRDNRQMLIDIGMVVPWHVRVGRWVKRLAGVNGHKKRSARWC